MTQDVVLRVVQPFVTVAVEDSRLPSAAASPTRVQLPAALDVVVAQRLLERHGQLAHIDLAEVMACSLKQPNLVEAESEDVETTVPGE